MKSKKPLWIEALILVAVFACAWFATQKLERMPPDGTDQSEWTTISVVYVRQLGGAAPPGIPLDERANDLHEDPWRQGVQATTFGWPNPALHKLVWGVACNSVAPERIFPAIFTRYHQGDVPRMMRATQPMIPAIERAQSVVAWASAACALMLFLLARSLSGTIGGLCAASLWVLHPMARTWSHDARPDIGMLLLYLAVPTLVIGLAPRLRGARGAAQQVMGWALVGLFAGMCAATKLNGALAGVFAALCVPLFAFSSYDGKRPRILPLLGSALFGGVIATGVLFAFFPYLWSAPLEHLGEVREFWASHMAFQQDRWESIGGIVTRTLGEKSSLVAMRLFGRDEPLSAASHIPGGFLVLSVSLIFVLWRSFGKGRCASTGDARFSQRLLLVWILVTTVGTTLWLPLDWDRYFFQVIAMAVLLESLLFGGLFARFAPASLSLASKDSRTPTSGGQPLTPS